MTETLTIDQQNSPSILNFDLSKNDKLEELLKITQSTLKPDTIIKGRIVDITKDFVTIDVDYKSQGQIAYSEFLSTDGSFSYTLDDEVEVFLGHLENYEGQIVLSREKVKRLRIWDEIKEIHKEDQTIVGKILTQVKGGLSVDIGIKAFLPGSQVDLKPIKDLDSMIGKTLELKVLKYDQKRGNVVLSRRAILEIDRDERRRKTLSETKVGAKIIGHVKNITNYGLFVDLGGVDGLLHITDMTWGRISHPSELYQIGDEIEVIVLSFDEESQRVSLGLKQNKPDPWMNLKDKLKVSDKVSGKIVTITNYGAFLEIEEGVEGLIHVSEMSWAKKVKNPAFFVQINDQVEAVVKEIDFEKKRLSLSMKEAQPNPWLDIANRYPVGSEIEGTIRNITDFGIFVGIEDDIDGLVHSSDISWNMRSIKNLHELFTKDQKIRVKFLSIDAKKGRLSLGIKQLTEDPWKDLDKEIQPGDEIQGKVVHAADFGIFVELREGLEGLIHFSQIGGKETTKKQMLEKFSVGSSITAKVIKLDVTEKRLALSPSSDIGLPITDVDLTTATEEVATEAVEEKNTASDDKIEKTDLKTTANIKADETTIDDQKKLAEKPATDNKTAKEVETDGKEKNTSAKASSSSKVDEEKADDEKKSATKTTAKSILAKEKDSSEKKPTAKAKPKSSSSKSKTAKLKTDKLSKE